MRIETSRRTPAFPRRCSSLPRTGVENGAIAIMAPCVLIVMIGVLGMALDLSRSYNRKIELQGVADALALAAASALDGTPEGIDRAATEAEQAATGYNFSYNNGVVAWSPAALKFGTSADAAADDWMDAATAKGKASKAFFAKVDTGALDAKHGKISNFFMPVLSPALAESQIAAAAVAGRDSLNVLPLAICANANTNAVGLPSGELVEYGFRRGVSYDLMNLNPGGRSPENFLVNPIAPAGTTGTTMKNRLDVVAPFVCTGKMAIPTLRGGDLTVERGFPLSSLYVHLNSRFGSYTAPCQASTAPADPNLTQFTLATATWMKFKPDGLSANTLTDPTGPLLTVAEKPTGATKTAYGPLWSFAKAAKYSSYLAQGGVEPVTGYVTFAPTDWAVLYNPGQPQAQSYPTTTPYQSSGVPAPYKAYRNTRVLHVPLLRCPVSTAAITSATVLGIGKFFMTVQASSTALYAEFAGMDTEAASGGNVRLYR
jgi:hypothetical protein